MRFKEGHRDALDKVYNLFAANLLYTAQGILKDQLEAEDIVIDAFHKCWLKRECFDSLQKVKSYLYVVIKHACFHALDKAKARNTSIKEITYLTEDEREEYMLQRMLKAELLKTVYDEIAKLPTKAKDLLTLIYVNGLSTNQISDYMQIPAQHVRVNKSRALHLLKQSLVGRYAF
ncbi:RNA polymerase ECF-type sigma factor [Filimonas lacunae]|nr:RNA polymerase ECF-type sigma factor [Filimonas lacunae]